MDDGPETEQNVAEALATGLTLADELALEDTRLHQRFLWHIRLRDGLSLHEAMEFFGTVDSEAP